MYGKATWECQRVTVTLHNFTVLSGFWASRLTVGHNVSCRIFYRNAPFLLIYPWKVRWPYCEDFYSFFLTIQLSCHSDPDQTTFHLLTKSSQYPLSCLHVWSFRGPWTLHLDGHLNTFNPSLRSPSQHFVRSQHHVFIVHPDNVNSRLRDNSVLFGIDVLDNAKYPNQQILTLDNYIFKLMSIHSLKWTVRIDTQNPGNNCLRDAFKNYLSDFFR